MNHEIRACLLPKYIALLYKLEIIFTIMLNGYARVSTKDQDRVAQIPSPPLRREEIK